MAWAFFVVLAGCCLALLHANRQLRRAFGASLHTTLSIVVDDRPLVRVTLAEAALVAQNAGGSTNDRFVVGDRIVSVSLVDGRPKQLPRKERR